MSTEGNIRLSVEVTKEVNDKLGSFVQWGLKADVVRALIDELIKAQGRDEYVVLRLLSGKCVLTDVQNLKVKL